MMCPVYLRAQSSATQDTERETVSRSVTAGSASDSAGNAISASVPEEFKNMTIEKAGVSATVNRKKREGRSRTQFTEEEQQYFTHGLTTEEKVAQMLMISVDAADISAAELAAYSGLGAVQLQWGSYSLEKTKEIAARLQKKARQAGFPPLFISVDYEGGSVYVPTTLGLLELPTNMMLGAANNAADTATLFYLAGKELRKTGINMALAPALDINTNPKNPIIGVRSLGADPIKTAELGKAIINGFKAACRK